MQLLRLVKTTNRYIKKKKKQLNKTNDVENR